MSEVRTIPADDPLDGAGVADGAKRCDLPAVPASSSWGVGGFALVAAAAVLSGIRRAEAPYADGDVLWGARAGRDFLATGSIPRRDAYSWTVAGRSWIPNSWGWNVVLGLAHRVAGLVGLSLLGIVVLGGVGFATSVMARRVGASPAWTALLLQILAGVFALFMYPRAQLADYAMIFVVPLLLYSALESPGRRFWRYAGWLILVQIVWMNMHSAAVLGPAMILVAGVGSSLSMSGTARARALRRVGALVLLTSVSCLATPYGTSAVTHLVAVRRASVGLISEWRPAGIASPEQLLGLAAVVIGLVAVRQAFRARRYGNVAVLLMLSVGTATAIRFAPMVALYAVPELAAAAGRIKVRAFFLNRICALALGIIAVACVVGASRFAEPGVDNSSPRLVAELPHGCRLLNDLGIGGDVMLRRPDVPVSIDSRNDLYGRELELQSFAVLTDPTAGPAFVRDARVTCVLVPTIAPLVKYLETQPGWRRTGSDSVRTLLVKATP